MNRRSKGLARRAFDDLRQRGYKPKKKTVFVTNPRIVSLYSLYLVLMIDFSKLKVGDRLIWPDRTLYWDWEYIGDNNFKCCETRDSTHPVGFIHINSNEDVWSVQWVHVPAKEKLFDQLYLRLKSNA